MSNDTKKVISVWDKVAADFGKVGPNYWNLFGERLVELSSIENGAHVLDIGMGRGASLFPAVKKAGVEGYVIGIDNSSVMVSETHKDIEIQNIQSAEVKVMSAENLDFDDNNFDNIICGFAIGCLLYSENKLNGVIRVLKSGGQASFSIWGIQEDQMWLTEIVNKYLNPQPKKNDNSAIIKFDNVQDVVKILQASGFKNVNVHEEKTDVIYKDKEEWWKEMCSNAVRGIFESIEAIGRDKFKEFKKEVFDGLEQFDKGDGYHFIMSVIYAYGEK